MRPFTYLLILLSVCACKETSQEPDDPQPEETISYQRVNADLSDIEIGSSFHYDIHVDGTLDYEENYFYSPLRGYDLTLPYYWASYVAGTMPLKTPRIHNALMCRSGECDSSQQLISGVWSRYDFEPTPSSLHWKFVTTDTKRGYEIFMNESPKEVKIVSNTNVLSTTKDNLIDFEHSGTDSLLFGVLVIPKKNLAGTSSVGTISSQTHFQITSKNNRFVIQGERVKGVRVLSTDTAFINLISLKRVIKVIEGKKVAINYRRNNIYPTSIK